MFDLNLYPMMCLSNVPTYLPTFVFACFPYLALCSLSLPFLSFLFIPLHPSPLPYPFPPRIGSENIHT